VFPDRFSDPPRVGFQLPLWFCVFGAVWGGVVLPPCAPALRSAGGRYLQTASLYYRRVTDDLG
jgi:hypothetical protein